MVAQRSEEVQLAWQVMTCRALRSTYDGEEHPCHFFDRHFGPYHAYDWENERMPPKWEQGKTQEFRAKYKGLRFLLPALAGGCRKAPIMVVGINPNLSAWWLSGGAGTCCYPYFEDVSEYAAYYRHFAGCQARLNAKLKFKRGTTVKAARDGTLVSCDRDSRGEHVVLTLKYGPNHGDRAIEVCHRGTVILPRVRPGKAIKEGQRLAGVLAPLSPPKRRNSKEAASAEHHLDLRHESMSYYDTIAQIFLRTNELLRATAWNGSAINPREDLLQGDMIACASPAWSRPVDGIPTLEREQIARACCTEQQWLVKQFRHTKPAILLFSGEQAFAMFRQALGKVTFLVNGSEPKPLPWESAKYADGSHQGKGAAWLLYTTQNRVQMMCDDVEHSPRVIVAPHFSYWRSSMYVFEEAEWTEFEGQPNVAKTVGSFEREESFVGKSLVVTLKKALSSDLEEPVRQFFEKHSWPPEDQIGKAVIEELGAGALTFDPATKHLSRTDVSCNFCNNDLFQIGRGCTYQKRRAAAK